MRDYYTKENMQGEAFHVPDAGLYFEPAELVFETETDTGREGVIRVRHRAGKPARGYVYPSERCMRGVREQFAPAADGTGYIRWQFDARGIAPGRTIQGSFRVITPYGEYNIPYMVEISAKGELLRRKNAVLAAGSRNGAARERAAQENGQGQVSGTSPSDSRTAAARPIRTKAEFLEMAEKDFEGAAAFFYSSRFEDILTEEEDRTIYRGLSMQEGNLQNVEEFLIAVCGKEKTTFEPVEKSLFLQTRVKAGRTEGRLAGSRAERAIEAHRQRVRRSGMAGGTARQDAAREEDLVYIPLQIRRTGNGFTGPVIRTEGIFLPSAPFAVPVNDGSSAVLTDGAADRSAVQETAAESPAAKDVIADRENDDSTTGTTMDEKTESEKIFTVRIPVNRAALHAGRNFGRLIIQGPFNEAAIPVEVHCPGSAVQMRRRQGKELELLQLQLMRLYVDFRLDEKLPDNWFLQADRLIDEISLRSHRDLIPRLYGVHLLILRGQHAEARRELGRIAVRYTGSDASQNFTARFTGEQEDAYCYRQYLYARCRMEDSQLRGRVVRFLRGIYRQTGDWRTAWMLLDLAEEYAPGTAARWNFLRHQFESGCNSPVIWIEAWDMVKADPQILLPGSSVQERWARDDFGLHVLWYAARNRVLTPKAAEVMIALAEKKKTFSGLLFRALCSAYEMWDEECRILSRADSDRMTGDGEEIQDPSRTDPSLTGRQDPADSAEEAAQMKTQMLRAVCILLVRGQDLSLQAHRWYARAVEAHIPLTNLEENWRNSMPAEDAEYRIPAGRNAVLRTTASRAVRAVVVYDRFRGEQVFAVRRGVAFLAVYGDANTIFLEDEQGNRYTKSLPYALDEKAAQQEGNAPEDPYALAEWIGFGSRTDVGLRIEPREDDPVSEQFAKAVGSLLDSGLLTGEARTRLLLMCLSDSSGKQDYLRFYLSKADPSQGGARERARLLGYLAAAGEYEKAMRWLMVYGTEGVSAKLLGSICVGPAWEGGAGTALIPLGWEAFLRGNESAGLLERLSAFFSGLSGELLRLRKACAGTGVSTAELDRRIIRQVLYSGAVTAEHGQIIVSAGRKLEDAFLPSVAQFADYAFSNGISMGNRMTDLIAGLIADGGTAASVTGAMSGVQAAAAGHAGTSDRSVSGAGQQAEREEIPDICRIACLKELSMRQGEISGRERSAAKASLSVLLSKGIIFPFYRQFPGYDDRLDLYAEETLVQYHPSEPDDGSGRNIVFHYTTSRRGEAGSYRTRPMKEMYRDFYVSGFLLFFGEQMHYYITDDAAGRHVVQSGIIGQDARILDNCSGRFGLINETTRAAALREYDEALSLLTGYYRRSYLESELFRR